MERERLDEAWHRGLSDDPRDQWFQDRQAWLNNLSQVMAETGLPPEHVATIAHSSATVKVTDDGFDVRWVTANFRDKCR